MIVVCKIVLQCKASAIINSRIHINGKGPCTISNSDYNIRPFFSSQLLVLTEAPNQPHSSGMHLIDSMDFCQSKEAASILGKKPGSILRHGFKEETSSSLWHGHKQEHAVELSIMYAVLNVIVPSKYTKCLICM